MLAVSVMIKPASGLCNMRCRYCFYQDEAENRQTLSYGIMDEATLEAVLQKVLKRATRRCVVAFQGGEPTLAGINFFQKAVELEKKHNVNGCSIENAIQTNGYALNREWVKFFAENHFLVGISLDGDKTLHDANRIDASGEGTYTHVMHAIQLLQSYHVEFNVLTVITAQNARSIRKIYRFYQRNGLDWQQYIPCLDPFGEDRGGQSWSLTPDIFARYLKDLFDCWYQDIEKGHATYNRYFNNLLLILQGRPPEACGMLGRCSNQLVVEADGSVYPCDFYALDEWRLGNLLVDSLDDIEQKQTELEFIEQSMAQHEDCLQCKWRILCRGGCRRDRSNMPSGPLEKNYFCAAYQDFFAYAYPRLKQLAGVATSI